MIIFPYNIFGGYILIELRDLFMPFHKRTLQPEELMTKQIMNCTLNLKNKVQRII